MVPAAHTDLILSALGEEWGFLGVAAAFALYALLVCRAFRIALRARTDYEFFLAAGLAAATALQVLVIAGGALGVLPLTGVVTPFLSYGRTAMLANFAGDRDAAFHLARARPSGRDETRTRAIPRLRWPPRASSSPCWAPSSLAKAAYVQVVAQRRRSWARARWWCRPMARAATSTIRAFRTS